MAVEDVRQYLVCLHCCNLQIIGVACCCDLKENVSDMFLFDVFIIFRGPLLQNVFDRSSFRQVLVCGPSLNNDHTSIKC